LLSFAGWNISLGDGEFSSISPSQLLQLALWQFDMPKGRGFDAIFIFAGAETIRCHQRWIELPLNSDGTKPKNDIWHVEVGPADNKRKVSARKVYENIIHEVEKFCTHDFKSVEYHAQHSRAPIVVYMGAGSYAFKG
jgi:hypothetical protein